MMRHRRCFKMYKTTRAPATTCVNNTLDASQHETKIRNTRNRHWKGIGICLPLCNLEIKLKVKGGVCMAKIRRK